MDDNLGKEFDEALGISEEESEEPTGNQEALPWEEGKSEGGVLEKSTKTEESAALPEDKSKKREPAKKETPTHHSEAPASATVKIKSPNGFSYMWTLRDDKNSALMFKVQEMEKKWMQFGWKPIEERSGGFPKKEAAPKVYVQGRVCPVDGGRLIEGVTRTGKQNIACENRKWDSTTKQAYGCSFIEWKN